VTAPSHILRYDFTIMPDNSFAEVDMPTPANHSVQKVFALLHAFKHVKGNVSISTIASETGISLSTTHRLMRTLEDLGVVVKTSSRSYRFGLALLALGADTDPFDVIAEIARPRLRCLSRSLRATVHLGVLDDEMMVRYLVKEVHPGSPSIPTIVGTRLEAYCSALGKVLLATLPEDSLEAYLNEAPFVALTAKTLTQPHEIRAELDRVRDQEFAVDDCEVFDLLRCVAVPIHGLDGKVIAALSSSIQSTQMDDRALHATMLHLRETAAEITRILAPRPISRSPQRTGRRPLHGKALPGRGGIEANNNAL